MSLITSPSLLVQNPVVERKYGATNFRMCKEMVAYEIPKTYTHQLRYYPRNLNMDLLTI